MVASKRDAIAAIIEMIPTANPDFLSEFSKSDLEQYLDRLGRAVASEDELERMRQDRPTDSDAAQAHHDPSDDSWFLT